MWLYEILEPVRKATVTARFKDTFKTFRKAYSGLDETLRDFIEFRLVHRSDEPYGAKDSAFVSPQLKAFRHFHMVHGRAMLIYQLTASELRLSLVMDHSYSSKQGQNSLSSYLNNPSTSYDAMPAAPQAALTKPQFDQINQLFFEFAAHDRAGLQQAISSNDLSDLMEFIRKVIDAPWPDTIKDRATYAAYGGVEGLRHAVQRVLHQTAPRH